MNKLKIITPYLFALLCAGFACTQDFFVDILLWLSILTMKLNYGWFTALAFILFVVWCGYQLCVKLHNYKYSNTFIATLLFFVITTLYYRVFDNLFYFEPLFGEITYVDALLFIAVVFIIEAIANKFIKKSSFSGKECSILLDSPIETPDEDKFDYYEEALHIANTISLLPNDKAVSVAVLSPWGNGKTSFVNLIKYAIKHGNDKKPMFEHIIVEFNPRQSKDIVSIQEDFFKTLTESFQDETHIRKKIGDYLENIGIQDVHPVAKIFTRLLKGTKKEAADEVNDALDNLNKRLIVFIDDFDRLTDVEIIEVLKLIDKNAAFRHMIFITAYDEKAVSNALRKYKGTNGISYIDKFFTLRFHLPLRSEHSVLNTMYNILQNKISSEDQLWYIMKKRYWIVAECVRSLRDVKNFCNMFQMDYVFSSKHKINFEEYFLLELMKFRYYDDYYSLFKKDYIVNGSWYQSQNADAKYTLKEAYSKDPEGNEPKGEQPMSINILRSIFPDYKFGNHYGVNTKKPPFRSVQYVRYFEMYFTNRSYGHVHAQDLDSLYMMQNDEEVERFYRQCVKQNAQSDIVDFLRYQNWQDITPKGTLTRKDTFKKFVRLVFLYSAITDDNDSYIHSLQLQLIYETNFEEKGYNDMKKEAYHDYLLEVIYNHDITDYIPLTFLMRITHTLIAPENDGVDGVDKFLLKSEEVKQKNLELFRKMISIQQHYSPRLSDVYRLCLERVENSHVIIIKEANDIMRDFLCKDKSNEYLNGFLVFNRDNEPYVSIAFKDAYFKQIFPASDEEDLFEKYVKVALPEDDKNRTEILAYLRRYRKAGSDHTGYYFVKGDNPYPSNMEIIEGLQF